MKKYHSLYYDIEKIIGKKKIIKNANTYWLSIVKYETMAHINVESRGRIHPTNK